MSNEYDPLTGDVMPSSTTTPLVASPTASISHLTTPEAIKQECMESLLKMLVSAKGDIKALAVVREVLDRLEGRPVQRNLNADASGGDVAKRLDAAIARERALKLNVVPHGIVVDN